MGRPLNKKYFGNRNIGTGGNQITGALSNSQNYADDRIGGEGVASISNATVGAIQINDTYKTFPGLTVAVPTLPGGVRATTSVVWEVATVSLAGGTGYTAGTITSITGLDAFGTTDTRFSVTVDGGGVPTFNAFTERGSYTSIDGTGITTWAVVGPAGDGAAQATITFRIKSIGITEEGSGYTAVPALAWSQVNGGTMPSDQTPTLTVDTGAPGTAGNQENAIVIYANTTIPASGTTALVGDIIKQTNTRSYKIKTADGIKVCKLGTDSTPESGGAYLVATATGGTYYVTKLTAHRATLVAKTGDEALDGMSVKWTFGAPSATVVQIENA